MGAVSETGGIKERTHSRAIYDDIMRDGDIPQAANTFNTSLSEGSL